MAASIFTGCHYLFRRCRAFGRYLMICNLFVFFRYIKKQHIFGPWPWWISLQWNERNRGHPTFFVAPFRKYLVAFSLMETNFSPQVPHLRLVRNERTLILLFWTRLVIGRKTLGGPGWVRYTVIFSCIAAPISVRLRVRLNFELAGKQSQPWHNMWRKVSRRT